MASLNTKLTQNQLVAIARRELLDTGTRWWTATELAAYVEDWQMELQSEFEFVWGTATATLTASTSEVALTAVATDIHRLDAIYWNDKRIVPRNAEELDILKHDWANDPPSDIEVAVQIDLNNVGFYPPPNASGVAVFEYPKILTFVGTSTMQIPAWTKYSCADFVAYRAFLRAGPNQDIQRAAKRKAKFLRQVQAFHTLYRNYFPDRYTRLRPGSTYEGDILNPNHPHLL